MPQSLYLSAQQHYQTGQLDLAEATLQKLLDAHPEHADGWHLLGIICFQSNRPPAAVEYMQKALQRSPRNLNYLNNLGLALRANQQFELALQTFQQAILLQPKDLDVQLNIANLFLQLNRFEEAAGYYRRLLRAYAQKNTPQKDEIRLALCHCLAELGNAAHAQSHFTQAEAAFAEAIQFNKLDANLYYNLANAERELGKATEASKHFQLAIQHNPNDADAYNNLGNVQRELGQLDLAIQNYQQALVLNPRLYHAKVHLVHQKQHTYQWKNLEDDINTIRSWVNSVPEAQVSPFAFLAMPNTTAEEQKTCATHWIKNRYATLMQARAALNFQHDLKPKKKLKIGYLSADFRLHPLAFLISEMLELHDRTQFEIIAFSFGVNDQSSARNRLVNAFDQFHDIRQLSEIDAAKKIFAEKIDILVDLTGFTQTSRSGIMVLKPAPIHVSWLGFAGTMGNVENNSQSTPLYDYLLTDTFISPAESAHSYAEKLAYLPCYQPNDRNRPIGKTPSRTACNLPDHTFVYCCFNQSFKITPQVFAIWMRILHSVPQSVLWLLECNPTAKQNLIMAATQHGIAPHRLIFAPRVNIADHLARHNHADLFLDTQPYNAHTTCSDALWMDVPVLTCVGETFSSRVAGSLLHAVNLRELITYSLQDYENKAIYYANNSNELKKIKQKLIENKSNSLLFDTKNFTKVLESIYQTMWNNSL
jgi:protein O-GlcNAc transferase